MASDVAESLSESAAAVRSHVPMSMCRERYVIPAESRAFIARRPTLKHAMLLKSVSLSRLPRIHSKASFADPQNWPTEINEGSQRLAAVDR